MKHYKSVKILSNFSEPKDFIKFSSDSYQFEKVRNMRIVNLTVTTIWVRFTWGVLLVCEIFTAVVSELQRGPQVVF